MTPLTTSIRVRDTTKRFLFLTLAAGIGLAACSTTPQSSLSSRAPLTTVISSSTVAPSTTQSAVASTTAITPEPEAPTTTTTAATAWNPPEVCRSEQCDAYESLVVLPVVFTGRDGDIGGDGVTYFRQEEPLWGPAGLIVDPEGAFWIADGAGFDGPRLIRVGHDGNGIDFVDIEGAGALGIVDIAPIGEEIAVLNVAGETGTYVEMVNHQGTVTNHIPLPEQSFGVSSGISGLAVTPDGQLLIEMEEGARTATVDQATGDHAFHSGYYTAAGSYRFTYPPPGATETVFRAPEADIPIAAPDSLGALMVIGVNPDHSFVISVDWMSFANSKIVDGGRQLIWYNADGTVHGIAEFPITRQAVHVEHPVFLATDGYLYGLLTRAEHVEVVRLNYRSPE